MDVKNMRTEFKRLGDTTSRGMILLPINPDYLLDTNMKSGNEIYVGYGKDMIVISKSVDVMNMIAGKNAALLIDKKRIRREKEVDKKVNITLL